MSTVRHDSYTRGTLRRQSEAVSGLHFFLMFVAAGLLVLTRVQHPLVMDLQIAAQKLSSPVFERINGIVQPLRNLANNTSRYFTVESEFRRLERELVSLRQILNSTSDLAARNEELAKLAKLVKSASVNAVTVEVIAGPQGLFGKSVKIGAGKLNGLRYGQPVFSGDGLFGRVVSVGRSTAKVLALNDINSRIAVEVGQRRLPALVVGDNSERPRLIYLSSTDAVRADDEVITSGASGEFPRGIKVGKVSVDGDEMRVETAAKLLAGVYLTVLKYEMPSSASQGDAASKVQVDSAVRGERGRMAARAREGAQP